MQANLQQNLKPIIMLNNLPIFISLIFGLTTLLTVWFFYKAAQKSNITLIILTIWLGIQTVVGLSGFYTVTDTLPPRFMLLVLPPLLGIIILFLTKSGRRYLDNIDIKTLTILHIVRIPVEIILFWLFIYKAVPQLMTFEGHNFDILSGISAPIIYYFAFAKNKQNKTLLLIWNFICLILLANIVLHAVLSSPSPFQKLAFDQPNIAIQYFPFVWLPSCVVPLVLLSHLAVIRRLLKK
ncbi:MAG: hypothetical protein SGJ10_10845 [Bacteroidota bacterium]|nr:hypothetical protein [Bacteroidota bacterium]